MTREAFDRELQILRESLLRLAGLVESQIDDVLVALRTFDRPKAERVRINDQVINELFRQIRERAITVIATQQPVAYDLRMLMAFQYIATELERIGDRVTNVAEDIIFLQSGQVVELG